MKVSLTIPAIFIAILFLYNALILWKRTKHRHTLMQFLSEILPRIMFGILYIWFFMSEVNFIPEIPIAERGNWVRAGLVYLALVEAIGNFTYIEKRRKL